MSRPTATYDPSNPPRRPGIRLTERAWRRLVRIVDTQPKHEKPCAADFELQRAQLIARTGGVGGHYRWSVTPAGLIAYGRLQHARRT